MKWRDSLWEVREVLFSSQARILHWWETRAVSVMYRKWKIANTMGSQLSTVSYREFYIYIYSLCPVSLWEWDLNCNFCRRHTLKKRFFQLVSFLFLGCRMTMWSIVFNGHHVRWQLEMDLSVEKRIRSGENEQKNARSKKKSAKIAAFCVRMPPPRPHSSKQKRQDSSCKHNKVSAWR